MEIRVLSLVSLLLCLTTGVHAVNLSEPLPSGTWVALPNTKLKTLCPTEPTLHGATGCSAVVTAWSSGAYDTLRQRLLVWGGGHNDYYGNELYALNVLQGTIERLTDPGLPVGNQVDAIAGGTQPASRHTMDGLVYVSSKNWFLNTAGLTAGINAGGGSMWAYDLALKQWKKMNPSGPLPAANTMQITGYDPVDDIVWVHDHECLYSYDVKTNSTAKRFCEAHGFMSIPLYRTGVIDPGRRLFLIIGGGQTLAYNIAKGIQPTVQVIPTTGGGDASAYPGVAFNTATQEITTWNGGNTVYTLDWATKKWFPHTAPGGPTVNSSNGTYKRFAYDAVLDMFVLVSSMDANAYVLKLGPVDLPVPPPAPPPPLVVNCGKLTGYPVPSLADEKAAYTRWGWTWTPTQEPSYPAAAGYVVRDPDIHGDSENDDLETNIRQYCRTGQQGFLDRAIAWTRYFKEDYRQCVGTNNRTYCYDAAYRRDHLYGWGLVAWFEATGDMGALTAAQNLGADVEAFWNAWTYTGFDGATRQMGRHLMLASRLADVTKLPRWSALRDKLISKVLGTYEWNTQYGFFMSNQLDTDAYMGGGSSAYAAGVRGMSSMQAGQFIQGLHAAYRSSGNVQLRERLLAMGRFAARCGVEPTYQYAASFFGVNILTGQCVWNYTWKIQVPTYWDPSYTETLVNMMVLAYKFTGDTALLTQAQIAYNRGGKAWYVEGALPRRTACDTCVGHFLDTEFDTASEGFYFARSKGELPYVGLLFENGGLPIVEGVSPLLMAPQGLSISFPH